MENLSAPPIVCSGWAPPICLAATGSHIARGLATEAPGRPLSSERWLPGRCDALWSGGWRHWLAAGCWPNLVATIGKSEPNRRAPLTCDYFYSLADCTFASPVCTGKSTIESDTLEHLQECLFVQPALDLVHSFLYDPLLSLENYSFI